MHTNSYQEFLSWAREQVMYTPMTVDQIGFFLEKGGKFVEDNVENEEKFLEYYTERVGKVYVQKVDYEHYFNLYQKLIFMRGDGGVLPSSFMKYGIVRMCCFMARGSKFIEKGVVYKEKKTTVDFLGYEKDHPVTQDLYRVQMGEPPLQEYVLPDPRLKRYFAEIKGTKPLRDVAQRYRDFLQSSTTLMSKLQMFSYDNFGDYVTTFERQIGYYYEIMYNLKQQGYDDFFIPEDGLGIVSVVCVLLGLNYRSYETHAYGYLATGLGLVTSSNSLTRGSREILIACNLSDFESYMQYDLENYVVIDENRLWEGCKLKDMKRESRGRVFSDLKGLDDLISFGGPIANSASMIKNTKNVPLSSKAEAFLVLNDIPVFSDGVVQTKTRSQVSDEGDDKIRYIDVVDYTKEKKRHNRVTGNIIEDVNNGVKREKPFFNIITRNHPKDFSRGVIGNVKFKDDVRFALEESNVVVTDDEVVTFKAQRFRDPRRLYLYERIGMTYVSYVNEKRYGMKTYLLDEYGNNVEIMYMHSLMINGKRRHVYRDKKSYHNVHVLSGDPEFFVRIL